MINKEQVLQWAREVHKPITGQWFDMDVSALEHFARLVHAAALEETKEACAQVAPKYPMAGHQYICGNNDAKYDCMDAIEALKVKP